jgi:hypothetical protein
MKYLRARDNCHLIEYDINFILQSIYLCKKNDKTSINLHLKQISSK